MAPDTATALEGLKVLDLMWVIAGPTATRYLADYGATVVRVESTKRVETARTIQPFHKGQPGPENSGLFGNYNANKYGITLDLGSEAGREVVKDLVAWADIVTESFSPRAMRGWGLGYDDLRAIKPDIIMLSTCLFGQSGPLSDVAGFGTMGSAVAGFVNLAGEPDRHPVGPFGAYTDYIAPRFTVCALLAALDRRDRTGEGCYIDQSQAESSMHFMTAALLDYEVNGRIAQGDTNHDAQRAPHGVYPAAGDDEWVAIAVQSDDEFEAFCEAADLPALAGDPRFDSLAKRKRNEDTLDELVAVWTAQLPAADIEASLQNAGVAAHRVQGSSQMMNDPHLRHREYLVELPHDLHGTTVVEASRFHLSRTPAQYRASAPTFGRDNDHVLREILGYDDDRITDLIVAGALE